MPVIKYKKVKLSDIFDFTKTSNGSFLTKSFVDSNKGDIPVYGTSLIRSEVGYGYIKSDLENVKYFHDCLTINRNGSAGKVFYRKGKFTINSDVTPLVPFEWLTSKLWMPYLEYAIDRITFNRFSWGKKAGKGALKEIEIIIPVDNNGNYDLEKQKELAEKYVMLEQCKRQLLQKVDTLPDISIEFNVKDVCYKMVPITDLFTPKGGSMKYSKSWCNENGGDYAVYSGSTTEIFSYVNEFCYSGDYLTWVIDGLAGYVMRVNGKFCITCHRGILIPTEKCKNIDLDYIKYVIEPIFRKRIRGRIGINGKNEYTALKPTHIIKYNDKIPVPVDESGKFDIDKQRELAEKYIAIERTKKHLLNKVHELIDISIEV